MTTSKISQDKLSALGADISETVEETMHKARPALNHMADSLNDKYQSMAQRGKDVAFDTEMRMEKQARNAQHSTEHYIQHSPFQSVLIAAGTGATMAMAVSWLMYLRKH